MHQFTRMAHIQMFTAVSTEILPTSFFFIFTWKQDLKCGQIRWHSCTTALQYLLTRPIATHHICQIDAATISNNTLTIPPNSSGWENKSSSLTQRFFFFFTVSRKFKLSCSQSRVLGFVGFKRVPVGRRDNSGITVLVSLQWLEYHYRRIIPRIIQEVSLKTAAGCWGGLAVLGTKGWTPNWNTHTHIHTITSFKVWENLLPAHELCIVLCLEGRARHVVGRQQRGSHFGSKPPLASEQNICSVTSSIHAKSL